MTLKKNIYKQKGGEDVVKASVDLVKSMVDLGKSIFNEIHTITHIESDINNVSRQTAVPGVQGPPPFNQPNLDSSSHNESGHKSAPHIAPLHIAPPHIAPLHIPPPPRIHIPHHK